MGPELVEGLEGSLEAKAKLKEMLSTVAGQSTVRQACDKLGFHETYFYRRRTEVLQAALSELEPKPAGRPPRERNPLEEEVAKLKAEKDELRIQLEAARVREELGLAMPHVIADRLGPADPSKKKTTREEKRRRAKERKRQGKEGTSEG